MRDHDGEQPQIQAATNWRSWTVRCPECDTRLRFVLENKLTLTDIGDPDSE